MEWQGINLTNFRARQWVQNIYRQFISIFLISMIAIVFASYLRSHALQIDQKNRQRVSQNHYLNTELADLERKLEQGRNSSNVHISQTLTEWQVIAFLDLLQSLPLPQGGVDTVVFEHNEAPSMTITGSLMQLAEFEQLEKYLASKINFTFSLVHFQVNQQHKIEFSLNILLKE